MIRNALSDKAKFDSLSPRERQVVDMTLAGCQDRTISLQLSLSPQTVRNYRDAACRKLGVRGRAGLVRFAARAGLI